MNSDEREMEAIETHAAQWVFERDGGLSADRRAALESWLSADARHRDAYLRFDEAWRVSAGLRAWRPADGRIDSQVLAGPSQRPTPDRPRGSSSKRRGISFLPARAVAILATLLLAVLLGVTTWVSRPSGTSYSTAVGGYERVVLDDGSILQLNTNTKLHVLLTARDRRVRLDRGEAYFDVAHDRARPFIVQAGNRRIVAVGTQFAVRRDGEGVRVSVTEGTVRLAEEPGGQEVSAEPRESMLLPAGSVARLAEARPVRIEHQAVPEVESQLAWRTGTLAFHNQALGDVVAEINRYNRRQFVITDPTLASLPFGGNIRSTDPQSLIDALRTLGIRADETSDTVALSRNSP